MNISAEIVALLKRELLLEWRQKFALNGILLYVVSTVFVCYMAFKSVDPVTWITLFWIILLFTSVNAIAKSFLQESKGKILYIYTIANPISVIFSKILYNVFLMLAVSAICLIFYVVIMGNPVKYWLLFGVALLFGSSGLACGFTMVSAIASKAGNNFTLIAILSFPVVIPLLMMLISLSKNAIVGMSLSNSINEIIILVSINTIIIAVSYILFPYLWRD